jgi:hypothetical protein
MLLTVPIGRSFFRVRHGDRAGFVGMAEMIMAAGAASQNPSVISGAE